MSLLEQPSLDVVDPAHSVVVQQDTSNPAIFGESARLLGNRLRCQDACHWCEQWVAVHELQVARELLDSVDIRPALDLDGHMAA